MPRKHQFTVYDQLEAKGVFEANAANASSPAYTGPVEYPKMLYHPNGAERVTVPPELVQRGNTWIEVGEQRELIHELANSAEEEKALLEAGWHLTPAQAMKAAGKTPPAMTPEGTKIAELERQLREERAKTAKHETQQQVLVTAGATKGKTATVAG